MKIFLLIHGQDTDSTCDTSVKLFVVRQAAWDAMRREWNEAVTAWDYASKEHGDEDECSCREDAAVIRDGGDVEYWRIEEQELAVPVSVAVEMAGGLVQAVYARGGDVDADVFDLDEPGFPDEGEQEETESRKKQLEELIGAPGWKQVW